MKSISRQVPYRELRSFVVQVGVTLGIVWLLHDALLAYWWTRESWCVSVPRSDGQGQPEAKYLVARLRGLSENLQLCNQVFEILGLEAIALKLGRIPVILLNDEFNDATKSQMWNALMYFPSIFDGYEIWDEEQLDISQLPHVTLHGEYNTYYDVEPLKDLQHHQIISFYGAYFQNYKYLRELGQRFVQTRLRQPKSAVQMVRDIAPMRFHQFERRLCIHMRRTDFVDNPSLVWSNSSFVLWSVPRIVQREARRFAAIVFSDDPLYATRMANSREYRALNVRTFIADPGNRLHPTPRQFNLLFMANYCTHVLLTAGESTYGFFGAYLSFGRAKVYYNNYHSDARPDLELPPEWTGLSHGIDLD